MHHIWEILWRSIFAFAIMMIIARQLGKSTVAQMTYHDFVAAITLGALTANLAYNLKMSFWEPLTSLLVFSFIAYLMMVLALKSRKLRKKISGQPTVLIQNGKILEENMKKLKLTQDTLNQELREKNIFDIHEVDYAVLELNGRVSVLKKDEYRPLLRKDLYPPSPSTQLFPLELIMDGKIVTDNLKDNDLTEEWLVKEIKRQGKSLHSINYAVRSTSGQLYFDEYKDAIQNPVDRE